VRALDAAADLLVRYGGHPVAAGFTLPAELIDAFTERLVAFVSANAQDLTAWDEVDAILGAADAPLALAQELAMFEPCGKGNPTPLLVAPFPPTAIRVVKDKHLFFRLGPYDAVWWSGAEFRPLLDGATAALGNVGLNTWNGRTEARFTVEDVA
jgi:single-stranded-DNA-specific exonuclease